jgi:hypothetical protein
MMPGEPVEPHVRSEVPPDDVIVIVRGGPIAAEKIVEHALRQAREYSYEGRPMYSVSVSLTVDGWDLASLLAGPLSSRTSFVASTVGAVRRAGFGLLPTYDAPHYDLLLGSAEYREAEALLAVFGWPEANPYKRRGR